MIDSYIDASHCVHLFVFSIVGGDGARSKSRVTFRCIYSILIDRCITLCTPLCVFHRWGRKEHDAGAS